MMLEKIKALLWHSLTYIKSYLSPPPTPMVKETELKQTLPYFIKQRAQGIIAAEWQYYLILWQQLSDINPVEDDYCCPTFAPLAQARLAVNPHGLLIIVKADRLPIMYSRYEAYQVAKAIYQLAYCYTTNPASDHLMALRKGIGFFLMQPFATLYPTEEVLHVLSLFRQLDYNFYRQAYYKKIYPDEEAQNNHSAVLIQRAFRAHQSRQHKIGFEPASKKLHLSMQAHCISQVPQSPADFTPFSKNTLNHWLNARKERDFYQKVFNNLVYYRSHKKFLKSLAFCVKEFNTFLSSLPQELRDYVLVVPDELKSNQWVTSWALPLLAQKPKYIVFPHEINNSIKHCVFFDDALYSGRQMRELVGAARCVSKAYCTIIVPFYNQRGLSRVSNADHFILGERMLSCLDLESNHEGAWTRKDTRTFERLFSNQWDEASTRVGVFFQHKTADSASTFLRDIPNIISPARSKSHLYFCTTDEPKIINKSTMYF